MKVRRSPLALALGAVTSYDDRHLRSFLRSAEAELGFVRFTQAAPDVQPAALALVRDIERELARIGASQLSEGAPRSEEAPAVDWQQGEGDEAWSDPRSGS